MMKSQKPRYDLSKAQCLAAQGRFVTTQKSIRWLQNHGYSPQIAKRVFLSVAPNEFVHSLPPARENGEWADVYRVQYSDNEISGEFYLKFVLQDECATVVLMSCKEWGYSW